MSSALADMLGVADGPARLRAQLATRALPLGLVMAGARVARELAAQLPDLAGPTILDLLHGRLQQNLGKEPGRAANRDLRQAWIGEQREVHHPAASEPPSGDTGIPTGRSGPATVAEIGPVAHESTWGPPNVRGAPRSPAIGLPEDGRPPAASQTDWSLPIAGNVEPARQPHVGAAGPPHSSRNGGASAGAILTALVRGYWSSHPDYDGPSPGTAAARPVVDVESPPAADRAGAWPLPAWGPARGDASWTELTGREAAQVVRAAVDGGPASMHAAHVPRAVDDVRIENIFNIEVRDVSRGMPDLDDLAEHLAGILRDQALQHGIDVS